jgi:predicted Ser/Thr protein kinase
MNITKEKAIELWNKKTPIAKGKRGLISLSEDENKKYCIKEKNLKSDATNRIFLEYENNKKLNEINVGPKIYYYNEEKDFLIRDFIEGDNIFEYIKKNKSSKDINEKIKIIILNILDQCRRMDKIKINKLEMTNPHKDIIIEVRTENNLTTINPIIIDFERCRFAARPKNVTQFCQFITKGNMKEELTQLKILFDKDKIMALAEIYKNDESDEKFNKLKEEIEKELN